MFDLSVDLMLVRYGQPVGVKALIAKPDRVKDRPPCNCNGISPLVSVCRL